MSTFPNNIDRVFVVNSVAPAGLRACDLKPTQLGLLDRDTQRTVDAASVCTDAEYEWIWKSSSKAVGGKVGDFFGVTEPIRSRPFTKLRFAKAFEGATKEAKPFIAYLGHDGANDCKTLSFECGRTYGMVIHVKGKNVRDVFGRDMTETIAFTTDCCEGCDLDESCKKTLKKIVDEIQNQSFYVKHFFDVDMISNCCPAPAPFPRTDFFDFCLSVCDAGDDSALSEVQVQYQDYNIYRSERKGGVSTYKTDCVLTAPADFTQTDSTIPNCDVCPDGFDLVDGGKKYRVTIDNDGTDVTEAQWLTAVQAAGAFSVAVSAKKLAYDGSVSTYEVVVPTSFVEPTTPIAETTFRYVGAVKSWCKQTTPITTSWVECGQSYKITRKLCITVKNGDCNATQPDLLEIQKMYENHVDIVPGSVLLTKAGDCNSVYELQQYSNCLVDGCDTVGADKAKFSHVAPYKGHYWQMCDCEGWTVDGDGCPVPPADPSLENCRCGLKFTGKFLNNHYEPCYWSLDEQVYKEGISLEVSIIDTEIDGCKPMRVDWTVVQEPTLPQGLGSDVYEEEVKSRSYENFMYIDPEAENGLRNRNALGFVYEAKPDKIYNNVQVAYIYDRHRNFYKVDQSYGERAVFYVEAHKTELLEKIKTLANSLIAAKGGCKLA